MPPAEWAPQSNHCYGRNESYGQKSTSNLGAAKPASFEHLLEMIDYLGTRWRSELDSNSRYRLIDEFDSLLTA